MPDGNSEGTASVPVPVELGTWSPSASPPRRRRTDAERNRTHVLRVARELMRVHGIAGVTMDALAEAAGVGKGTLYRGFGSRAGLAEALLDEAERDLQERILTGPPPLGPGRRRPAPAPAPAPAPGERLRAFAQAYLELLRSDAGLVLETERGQGARFHSGAYVFWHAHVAGLLRAAGAPDPAVRAHALLALLAADLYLHLRGSGVDHDRIVAVVTDIVGRPDP
jgi:AcrR family transcriptional regulator